MSNQANKDERLEYLRVFSCFMVILGHIANWYMREYPDLPMHSYIYSIFVNGICRVSVPIFFMIIGALILEQQTDYKKNIKRTLNMLSKTVVWTLVYIVWNFLYLGDKYELKTMFSQPVRVHFWFLFVMVGIYATIPLWQKLVSGDSKELLRYFSLLYIGVTAISFIIRLNKMPVAYEIPLVGGSCYAGLFIMGYVIRHYIDEIKIKKWISVIVILSCVTLTILLTLLYTLKQGRHFEEFSSFKSIFIVLAALSVFYLVMKANNLKHFTWMSVISKHSFGIYMIHVFFLDILQQNIDVRKISAFIGTPIFFVVLLALSLAFSWIYEKAKGGIQAI